MKKALILSASIKKPMTKHGIRRYTWRARNGTLPIASTRRNEPVSYTHLAGVEDVNYTLQSETHTAAETLEAQVLTMAQWKAMGAPAGPYWVYDTDGWAYCAQAIQPGEATGLLLNGIHLEKTMTTDCYYGIHVVAQFTAVSYTHLDVYKRQAVGRCPVF